MARTDFYRLRAQECLAAARACSDGSKAAQLVIIAACYSELVQAIGRLVALDDAG